MRDTLYPGITPEQVAALTQDGHSVALVKWADRVIPEQEYAKAVEAHGASDRFRIIGADDWKQQPAYQKSLILGTKELEDARAGTPEFPLSESYVHFDHSFKTQPNAGKRMARFAAGNGRLLDHEYWVDANGKRTHAFGHSAGYATAAISTLAMVQRMLGREVKLDQYAYSSPDEFFKVLVPLFKEATQNNHAPLKAVILGSPRF